MKTFVSFIITLLISTGCLLGAMNMRNPFPLFGVAFGIWGVFIWRCNRRAKKKRIGVQGNSFLKIICAPTAISARNNRYF
jgi:hypothetical protein